MPYLLISTPMPLESGPTIVGDEWSDRQLMEYLNATKKYNVFSTKVDNWMCEYSPRIVLNKLEEQGYRVVGMAGLGQKCIWTLHKPE